MHRKGILDLDKGLLIELCAHATERTTEILQVGTATSYVTELIDFLRVKISQGNRKKLILNV